MRIIASILLCATASLAAAAESDARFTPSDLAKLAEVAEPVFSPDGNTVLHVVTTANLDTDESQSDLWRVGFDGGERLQLTRTPDSSEWRAQWSPDGQRIAFLSDRKRDGEDDEDATTQVWVMPATGGDATR
ncbi:MAG: S9 family peptidase, partial [Lysobacteraceae bacterium]